MRHTMDLFIEGNELRVLKKGGALALDIGGEHVNLRLDKSALGLNGTNGHRKRAERAEPARCSYCKRDLTVAKHARSCRVLRLRASKKRSRKV